MASMSDADERVQSIDVLRGLAAVSVMLCHIYPIGAAGGGTLDTVIEGIRFWALQNGQTGVHLFFIISGFVIPSSLLRYDRAHLRRFWVSRIVRLYPAYWLSLGFAVLIVEIPASSRAIFTNLTMFQRFMGEPHILGVYWTLSVEMIFYGLVSVLFAAGVISHRHWSLIALIFAAVIDIAGALVYRFMDIDLPLGTSMFMTLMLFGTWLRLGQHRHHVLLATVAMLVVILIFSWLFYAPARFGRPWEAHFCGFALGTIAFSALHRVKGISFRPLVWLGEVSYSIYLFHTPLAQLTERYMPAEAPLMARFAVAVAVTLLVSGLVHSLVEKPFIRLGRRINARLVAPA